MTLADVLTLRVDFRDPEAAARITPEQANAYLAAHGWTGPSVVHEYAIWLDPSDGLRQALVPLQTHWRDYGASMVTLLNDLARHEDRSPLAVFAEMIMVRK